MWQTRPLALLLIGVLGANLLIGCSSGDEEVVPTTGPTARRSPTAVMVSTPVSAKPTSLGPIPMFRSEVSWVEAKALILNGAACQVVQLHSLKVTLHLRDGRRVVTIEPEIDEVFRVIERCGGPCSDMVMATE